MRRLVTAFPLLCLTAAILASALPADAKKRPKQTTGTEQKKPGKSLSEVVKATDKIEGLVTFYRSPDKLFMELPAELVNEPLGFAAVMVNAAGDYSMRGGAIDTQLVRWKRQGDHLTLVKENLDFRADAGSAMAQALRKTFLDSPAFTGKLVQLTDDPAPLLIDAAKLFGPDLAELLPRRTGYTVRPEDAILVSVKAFEDNIVARVTYRVRRQESQRAGSDESRFARFLRPGRLPDPRSAELTVDYNLFRLPEDGFQPRFADERIGGMLISYKDYSNVDDRDTLFRRVLRRWDVRKADPDAPMSDPVEPITFYVDPSVPEEWRALIREGALWWNPAFEKLGIRNAVQILDAPDDPDWDPADIRHSVIYWNMADNLVFSGAAGPSYADPRTGKVIKANVYLNGEFFSFALNRYLVYAWWRAPEAGEQLSSREVREQAMEAMQRNPRYCNRAASFSSQMAFARLVLNARGVIQPGTGESDRFAREAFLELVVHEVGHALGFPHNWKASLASSWDDVHAGRVTGSGSSIFSSSVMDYNPIYLAPQGQPQGDYFMQEVGPYDDLAVEYFYRPLDGMSPAEAEAALDAIAARAETEPGLIYDSGVLGNIDPTTNSDDIGDDPLAFAASRLAMLHGEVLPSLSQLVLDEGHDYNLLRQALDSAIFSVAMDYIDMSARHVGGQILLRRVAGSPAAAAGGPAPITPIAADVQRQALEVLDRYVFADGVFALPPETLQQMKADMLYDWNYPWRFASDYDIGSRIAGLYEAALSTLLDPGRLARVLDNERRLADDADRFTLPELFEHLAETAFGDLEGPLSADRRALQRTYLRHLTGLVLEPADGTPAEASQLAAATLRQIRNQAAGALDGSEHLDGYTSAHLQDIGARATRTLEASVQLPAAR